MKKWLTVLTVVFLSYAFGTGAALAQGGSIGLFADTGGMNCGVGIPAPNSGPVYVYVVHTLAPWASAAAFSVSQPQCASGLQWIGDNRPYDDQFVVGSSQTGVFVSYAGCRTTPFHALTIVYWVSGDVAPCCLLTVGSYQDICTASDGPCMLDCASNEYPATGGSVILNPGPACQCNVPTEESSWGRVKALYQ